MFDTTKITFLDGAMGTMLQQSGMKAGDVPELLALTNPELLTSIHRQYVEAGADVVYANTFGANRRKLAKHGVSVEEVVIAAVQVAKQACEGTSAKAALDIGPLGELLEPLGTLPFEAAEDMFAELVRAGVKAGADLIAIETMTDLYEAKAALLAAKENTAYFSVILCFARMIKHKIPRLLNHKFDCTIGDRMWSLGGVS